MQFRKLERLRCELVVADMKILEILIHEGEDEVCNVEYFTVEEHRKKLNVTERLKDLICLL